MEEGLYIRVKQALTWLKRNKGILQKDIADKMGMAEASFTRGLARIKEKRDEDFVIKFHSAVSSYISLGYLLNGEGELVADGSKATSKTVEQTTNGPDISSLFNSALSAKDETITSLQREMATKEELIASLRSEIEAKDDHIATLKDRLAHLRKVIDEHGLLKAAYPFPMGSAEPPSDLP